MLDAAAAALGEVAHRKAARTLILELNAARVTGRLAGDDPAARFAAFLELSADPAYWDSLGEHYPTLLPRLRTVLERRCAAVAALAGRFARDRGALADVAGGGPGRLTEARFGAGDSHRGGHTVAILTFDGDRRVVYKPRSVLVDATLDRLLGATIGAASGGADTAERIRVPAVVERGEYGWAEFIEHRFCRTDAELAAFYRRIGHWLAVMRLLGGSDLHAENVIAHGPTPVVVDCETLFSPHLPAAPSGLGQASDLAHALVTETVLRTGMLPSRGTALGWRGADYSALGALPGQQPVSVAPAVLDAGTDLARVGLATRAADAAARACHPSPDPVLARHWERIVDGFDEANAVLREADRDGRLHAALAPFADCPVRVVLRATEVYGEIGRMLWHPVSLHDPPTATARAAQLLAAMAESLPGAPDDPQIIEAEIDDLLHDDVPYFGTTPRDGRLTGPRGTRWLTRRNLIADALDRWRAADVDLDRAVIRAALVSAYLNDDMPIERERMESGRSRPDGQYAPSPSRSAGHDAASHRADLERRRRALAADLMRRLRDEAVRGDDGTATWIAPALGQTGWAVRPLGPDLYSGLGGVALLLAAYLRESTRGWADPVGGLGDLLDATLHTLRATQDYVPPSRQVAEPRPPAPGGYMGIGSQIRVWLTLHVWGMDGEEGVPRARALAALLPAALDATDDAELLGGAAGAIAPLLGLATVTGEPQWTAQARDIGERLASAARPQERGGAAWPTARWPHGLGGCAHGATGIGWALALLSLATDTGDEAAAQAARAAFEFEESLYDPELGGWLDLRHSGVAAVAWCHGAVGIGLCAADLGRRGWHASDHGADSTPGDNVLMRAAAATDRSGLGWNHTLCHGDAGCWELLDSALTAGCAPPGMDRASLDSRFIDSLEKHGPVSGLARDAFAPGLMSGLGGVAYQLLRMREGSDLPSVLVPGDLPGS